MGRTGRQDHEASPLMYTAREDLIKVLRKVIKDDQERAEGLTSLARTHHDRVLELQGQRALREAQDERPFK